MTQQEEEIKEEKVKEEREDNALESSSKDDPVEKLHAICYHTSIYHLKLALKRESLFDSRSPLLVVQDDDNQSIAKIPTHLIQSKTTSDAQTENYLTVLPINHPSVKIPSTFIQSVSDILLGFQWIQVSSLTQKSLNKNQSASPLLKAVEKCFGLEMSFSLMNELPGWELYDNFLLFQSNGFQLKKFLKLLEYSDDSGDSSNKKSFEFFKTIANEFKVSHVARKGLIDRMDVSRQPKLIPLYGRFREEGYEFEQPKKSFDQVFWTCTKFHTPKGTINYVWAPSETMYSRGNSKEKIRISNLTNVTGQIVVDMCCGIGFFSFGYLLAGASQVIACEISPWAVEGIRRGAIANGFSYEMLQVDDDDKAKECSISNENDKLNPKSEAQLLIFHGSNELALPIYRHKATHVNLGLLPSSIEFLPQSVEALRPQGGWLHVHGEVAAGGGPIARQNAANIWAEDLAGQVVNLGRQSARPINIHWIKSIGPAKEHLVVELEVGPL